MSRTTILRLMITALAWAAIIFITYATLTKVGFVYAIYFRLSPFLMGSQMRIYARIVHFIAFAGLGALFSLAYPRRTILVCCIVLGGAALLELAQTLTPDRHGTLSDAVEKITGGATGILITRMIQRFFLHRQTTLD